MKKKFILFGLAGFAAFISCTDHEVIPPPVPLVDLNCDCSFEIGDSINTVKYTDSCYYESAKTIETSGSSKAQYRTRIENVETVGGLEIEMRSIVWDDNGSNNPTLAEWKTFFLDNFTPGYSGGINHNGIAVSWTDLNGKVWKSDTTESVCIESFEFNTLIQESDTTGDYIQFDATFNCSLLNSDYGTVDSLRCLHGAHVRSAFKLE